ncbi:MAG: hypothetical protein ACREQ5_00675 [Candidatus Dormibacteria bacterium]
MQILSWERGDPAFSQFPNCTAYPLAVLMQGLNDWVCRNWDLLCPDCSMNVLRLAHDTVGTATPPPDRLLAWVAELFDITAHHNPDQPLLKDAADLCRRSAKYPTLRSSDWDIVVDAITKAHASRYPRPRSSVALDVAHGFLSAYPHDRLQPPAVGVLAARLMVLNSAKSHKIAFTQAAIDAWHHVCGATGLSVSRHPQYDVELVAA